MYPSAVSHDSGRLGDIERFVSVNTAIEVDLYGNVNSEVVGGRQISGPGGSLDYVDTAARSKGGLRVIALPSQSSDGSVSRIVPSLGTVTIPRSMVDAVVTEHGVAHLAGLTTRERAQALIAIAHPDHQQALGEAAAQ
jgi:acyl-CoA hydrolase